MKKLRQISGHGAAALLCLIICSPVLMLVNLSFQDSLELSKAFVPPTGQDLAMPDMLPLFPTLDNFGEILLESPQFYKVFWNSLGIAAAVTAGQLIIAVPAAWGFSRTKLRFRRQLFDLYVLLMLMPFQVTMLSQYIMLDKLGLMDTRAAIILPAVFSAFPVFIIYRSFCSIPEEVLESARIDGAGEWQILLRIGIPMGSAGIMAAVVLGFLDLWNMVEQPLAFIRDRKLYPLSLYLPMLDRTGGSILAASAVTLIPAAFVFVIGQDKLEAGIIASAVKE
ncbi:carbohydrate ABC transporter permease [Ruminococcus sp.]|uniref:carbohydrate ABC transporter permease n=1 Tax=Ruminococcus sp. TaxID=41978 RepID=UPI0025D724EB|nr:carbohydrate ABC transporter permease [Ruminococcus sp.]MBQ8966027.1 carbohydrate ABC transporter permease [Ruminococcus sp.]